MTRPVPWRRSTAPARRRQRRLFHGIKAAVDASPEIAAYRADNRKHAAAQAGRDKVRRALAGEPVLPLTEIQFAALNLARRAQAAALGLSPPGPTACHPSSESVFAGMEFLILAEISDAEFKALADYVPES